MVDDGTGVVQCALFLSNMDGSETSHYRAGVGEAVVIAGALNVGWKHGAMNEVCRCVPSAATAAAAAGAIAVARIAAASTACIGCPLLLMSPLLMPRWC